MAALHRPYDRLLALVYSFPLQRHPGPAPSFGSAGHDYATLGEAMEYCEEVIRSTKRSFEGMGRRGRTRGTWHGGGR